MRPSHLAIADWTARRSASGIPAESSACASGQPVRPRRRCFGGAEDVKRGRCAIIADATTSQMPPSQPRASPCRGRAVPVITVRQRPHPWMAIWHGMIRPTPWPAGRAAVLLNYVLRPAVFIGHGNVRWSLNVAGEFRTSKKRCLRFGHGRGRLLSQRLNRSRPLASAFG